MTFDSNKFLVCVYHPIIPTAMLAHEINLLATETD
jgi:hypothetical protein